MRRSVMLWSTCVMLELAGTPRPAAGRTVGDFYKGMTMHLIVGVPAGGEYDVMGRFVMRHLVKHIPGNPAFITENMPGASGRLAAGYLYNLAAKDGSVIGAMHESLPLAQAAGEKGVRYDAAKFAWIGSPVEPTDVLLVSRAAGVRDMEGAKEKPLMIGATSNTGTSYLYPTLANKLLGSKFKVITGYEGGNAIDLAIERGEVQGRGSSQWYHWKVGHPDWVRDGKVVPLFQITLEKDPDLPNVPRFVDLAPDEAARGVLQALSLTAEIGRPLLAPPGVPAERVAALRQAFDDTMTDPDFLAEAATLKVEVRRVPGRELQSRAEKVLATPKGTLDLLRAASTAP